MQLFVVVAVVLLFVVYLPGYVRTQSYSINEMEEREKGIRLKSEEKVDATLAFHKRWLFNWILFHARRAVKHRENLRFARTKLFGVFRDLFRAIGTNLVRLGLLRERQVRMMVGVYTLLVCVLQFSK